MKKSSIALLSLSTFLGINTLFNSNQATAQDFKAGVLVGVNATQIDGDTYGGFDKTGFKFGGFVKRHLNKEWAVQMELLYNQRGSQAPTQDDENPVYKYEINYLDMPIMAQYYFIEELYAEAGIELGYLLSAKEERDFLDLEAADRTKNFSMNWGLGVGYNFYDNFSAHLRYNRSLIPVRGSSENLEDSNKGQISRVISFGVSYQFNK